MTEDDQQVSHTGGDGEGVSHKPKSLLDTFRNLLKGIDEEEEARKNNKNNDADLEITWVTDTKEKTEKSNTSKEENLTPFEQYIEKRKAKKKAKKEEHKKLREQKNADESADADSDDSIPSDIDITDSYFAEEMKNNKPKIKKSTKKNANSSDDEEEARRKAELELLLLDDEDDNGKKHFNIKKIEDEAALTKSKRKRILKKKKHERVPTKPDDDFQVDVADPRFGALYSSHHFNIDPADSHYRKTKGTDALVTEKLKRRVDPSVVEESLAKKPKINAKMSSDLAALVKSVKTNTKNIAKPIKY